MVVVADDEPVAYDILLSGTSGLTGAGVAAQRRPVIPTLLKSVAELKTATA
jgi:hypothetical protein